MADTRQELEGAVFDLAARVASVRAALSAAITDDVDEADRLDMLEGCYSVLGDAMDSMWTAWERFDQGQVQAGATPEEPPHSWYSRAETTSERWDYWCFASPPRRGTWPGLNQSDFSALVGVE